MADTSTSVLDVEKYKTDAWSTAARLQLDAWKAYGDVSLTLARADLTESQTRYADAATDELRSQVRMKEITVSRYVHDYNAFLRQENKLKRQIATVQQREADLSLLQKHQWLTASAVPSVWTAFCFFLLRAPAVAMRANTTMLPTDAIKPTNFCYNLRRQQQPLSPDEDVHTVGDLIHWLQIHNYMPKSGTAASRLLYSLIEDITAAAMDAIGALDKVLNDAQQGIASAWPSLNIMALPTPPAVKALVDGK